jgi:hypothetical protein
MMFSKDYAIKQEQYKDLLREAEKERLVRQMTANREKPAIWQGLSVFLSDIGKEKSTMKQTLDSRQVCCAEEAF